MNIASFGIDTVPLIRITTKVPGYPLKVKKKLKIDLEKPKKEKVRPLNNIETLKTLYKQELERKKSLQEEIAAGTQVFKKNSLR